MITGLSIQIDLYVKIHINQYTGVFRRMKRKRIQSIIPITLLFILFLLVSSPTLLACSGFMMQKDGNVLIAHNKDWWSPDTSIHFFPRGEDTYACLFLEIPFPHIFNNDYMVLSGGINEEGLCYESFVTPFNPASFSLFKPPLFKNPVDHILKHSTTVQEAIDYIESHNLFFLNYILAYGQIFVIDRYGDAAIIEGDDIIRIKGDYQICTNYLQSNPKLGNYPCWRYEYLTEVLNDLEKPSIPIFESLLENVSLFTQYSWIYDPNDSVLHLYHFHDYEHGIILDLEAEFKEQAHSYYLPALFEPDNNSAPDTPEPPTGPTTGFIKTDYVFQIETTDDDNPITELYHRWDFGDGTQTYWLYNYELIEGMAQHAWKKPGSYQITVQVRDIYGKESPWSDPLEIQITRNNPLLFTSLLERILASHQ